MRPDGAIQLQDFLPRRRALNAAGKKLVFTNGVFDLIHRGHVEYLCDARAWAMRW